MILHVFEDDNSRTPLEEPVFGYLRFKNLTNNEKYSVSVCREIYFNASFYRHETWAYAQHRTQWL